MSVSPVLSKDPSYVEVSPNAVPFTISQIEKLMKGGFNIEKVTLTIIFECYTNVHNKMRPVEPVKGKCWRNFDQNPDEETLKNFANSLIKHFVESAKLVKKYPYKSRTVILEIAADNGKKEGGDIVDEKKDSADEKIDDDFVVIDKPLHTFSFTTPLKKDPKKGIEF